MRIGNVAGRPWIVTGAAEGIDVGAASGSRFAPDLTEVYDRWNEVMDWAHSTTAPPRTFDPVDLGPPSPAPRQVFAIGLNYLDHAREANMQVPPEPSTFTKFQSCLAGPDVEVVLPTVTVDWEAELVLVIGRTANRVGASEAWKHVAGLSVGQDLTDRHLQMLGVAPQFSLGKSFSRFGPFGPTVVTPDELANPDDLEIGARLNGEQVQKARTAQLAFPVDHLIERLSRVVTLYPGDVIFTGTPSGVGAVRTPPLYLKPGDELLSYVEGIGEIRQTFVADHNIRSDS